MEAYRFNRVDVVCDRYFKDSLKEQTRDQRGTGTRCIISDDEMCFQELQKHSITSQWE